MEVPGIVAIRRMDKTNIHDISINHHLHLPSSHKESFRTTITTNKTRRANQTNAHLHQQEHNSTRGKFWFDQKTAPLETLEMQSHLLTTIPLRNARAVALLQSGEVGSASRMIRLALEQVRDQVGSATSESSQQVRECHLEVAFAQCPLQDPTQGNGPELAFLCPCFVFARHGNTDPTLPFNCSKVDGNLLNLCLLYNLGVCHHFRALSPWNTGRWSRNVQKAITLYCYAISVVNDLEDFACNDCELAAMIRPLAVALGNNLAALYAEIYDWKKFEACLDWTIEQASATDDSTCSFYFWTNLIMWNNLPRLPSPAA